MSPSEQIRLMYRGGQAAMAAEISVILGIFMASLSQGREGVLRSFDMPTLLNSAMDMARQTPLAYLTAMSFNLLLPSFCMLWVIWTWHLYFQSQGFVVFHWFLSSIGLIGLTCIFISYALAVMGLFTLMRGIDEGYLTQETAYSGLAILLSLQFLGVGLTYWLYTAVVVLTVISQWKLSRPVMLLGSILFVVFNSFALALSPFILGVLMLSHVNRLARGEKLA